MAAILTKKEPAKAARKTQLSVDYPRQNEIIGVPQYTLRVSAPESAKSVEVAIDHKDYQPCRQAVGYWWFDWSGYEDGEHEIVTRIETKDGARITSEPHEFFVDMQPKPARP